MKDITARLQARIESFTVHFLYTHTEKYFTTPATIKA